MDIPMVLNTEIQQLQSRLSGARVLVVGDVMLDRYWFGDVARISPEAPVPIAKIAKTDQRAGGAANVARNIASLGGKAALLSVTGKDEAADALEKLMKQDGVASYLMRDKEISTTVKLRVVARNQQLIRLDFEEMPHREILDSVKEQYRALLPEYDVVVLSDYGKGGLLHVASMIEWARLAGKPVLIDPKGDDYEKYAGATLLTPNRAELKEVVGSWRNEAELTEKAQNLRRNLDLEALLLTRSEEGMTLFRSSQIDHQPTRAQEVYDVSGAGDTVIASMGLGIAAGFSLPEAMHIANTAAGVVVAKLGTAVCSFDELSTALKEQQAV
ncbi:D-glycero-beta-D-manno-heptose-7-phosphate kinase [Neisseria sp. Dent CA1/247]|uniref:D-glycero-beta-D-manno-heptose-7-phosphate kinase n=1 Tax=Neisseria sp. Dent CA1/247 TaxID=2912675 RepID=UPI00272CE1D7|nr:D-glycero-beta-D-manno-heptose-7-phosphate kinase [Neisseria sp. Dent CA1/247]